MATVEQIRELLRTEIAASLQTHSETVQASLDRLTQRLVHLESYLPTHSTSSHHSADPDTVATTDTSTTTPVKIKAPESYKAQYNIRAWIDRVTAFLNATQTTCSKQRAAVLASLLSNDVYETVSALNWNNQVWHDYTALASALIAKFEDTKTQMSWERDFQSAKQEHDERIRDFFDRLSTLFHKAHPESSSTEVSTLHFSVFRNQFINGARDVNVRRGLTQNPLNSLRELKERAILLEDAESIVRAGSNQHTYSQQTLSSHYSTASRPQFSVQPRYSYRSVLQRPPNSFHTSRFGGFRAPYSATPRLSSYRQYDGHSNRQSQVLARAPLAPNYSGVSPSTQRHFDPYLS